MSASNLLVLWCVWATRLVRGCRDARFDMLLTFKLTTRNRTIPAERVRGMQAIPTSATFHAY